MEEKIEREYQKRFWALKITGYLSKGALNSDLGIKETLVECSMSVASRVRRGGQAVEKS